MNIDRQKKKLCVAILCYILNHRDDTPQRKTRLKRTMWVRDIYKMRRKQGDYHNLVAEMRLGDVVMHYNYMRMSKGQFDAILCIVGPDLTKDAFRRETITASERLALTIRYLASGDSMASMAFSFRISRPSVSKIIRETTLVLWSKLKSYVLLSAPTEEDWQGIADGFEKDWNLPNCVGAIDGKHIIIQAPWKSGSEYYNYKNSFSIVLMATCDSSYKFVMVDVGAKGRQSDGGIFRLSPIGRGITNNTLNFPKPKSIEDYGDDMPYYIVGDEAFPLMEHLMRPYPGRFLDQEKRVYNYRLSRGRRVIENAFGILSSKWRKSLSCFGST